MEAVHQRGDCTEPASGMAAASRIGKNELKARAERHHLRKVVWLLR
jgi:hypothetical protein